MKKKTLTNKQMYVNMCICKREKGHEVLHAHWKTIFLEYSFKKDFKVLKMMCNYWKVDLRTGFQMLSNYCVTGDENNTI